MYVEFQTMERPGSSKIWNYEDETYLLALELNCVPVVGFQLFIAVPKCYTNNTLFVGLHVYTIGM
jgi:hypothetical protein